MLCKIQVSQYIISLEPLRIINKYLSLQLPLFYSRDRLNGLNYVEIKSGDFQLQQENKYSPRVLCEKKFFLKDKKGKSLVSCWSECWSISILPQWASEEE